MTKNVEKWLHRSGGSGPINHEALDRIADVIMDGMSAAGRGELSIPEKLTVLRKVTAMLLAALSDLTTVVGDDDLSAFGETAVAGYIASLGGALEQEIRGFRRALARDQRAKKI